MWASNARASVPLDLPFTTRISCTAPARKHSCPRDRFALENTPIFARRARSCSVSSVTGPAIPRGYPRTCSGGKCGEASRNIFVGPVEPKRRAWQIEPTTREMEREGSEWARDFHDLTLPPRNVPPFQRDHRLPIRGWGGRMGEVKRFDLLFVFDPFRRPCQFTCPPTSAAFPRRPTSCTNKLKASRTHVARANTGPPSCGGQRQNVRVVRLVNRPLGGKRACPTLSIQDTSPSRS